MNKYKSNIYTTTHARNSRLVVTAQMLSLRYSQRVKFMVVCISFW